MSTSSERNHHLQEEGLIEKARRGDPQAFDLLIRKHRQRILPYLINLCQDQEDAEEVAQEAYLSAFQGIKGFQGRSSFFAWLRGIAHHLCLRRRRRKQPVTIPWEKGSPEEEETSPSKWLASSELSPEQQVLQKELQEQIEAALHRLTPENREIFILDAVEGLSNREIAEIMGVSLANVKIRLHRIREFLRKELTEYLNTH